MSLCGNSTISLVGRPLSSGYGSMRYSSGVRQYFGSAGQGEMSNFSVPAQQIVKCLVSHAGNQSDVCQAFLHLISNE